MRAIDSLDYENFEDWWEEIVAYAEHHRLAQSYVEEEFIIDAVFYPIGLQEDLSTNTY